MTKDSGARTVPLCDALHVELKAIPKAIHDPHVFLFRGKPVTHIRTGLKLAWKKAGIEYGRFVFHDLRHTFNTNMRKAGVSGSVIMAITGHATREMFDRYNRVDGDDVATAINQLECFLQNGSPNGGFVKNTQKATPTKTLSNYVLASGILVKSHKKRARRNEALQTLVFYLVPRAGLEPARP